MADLCQSVGAAIFGTVAGGLGLLFLLGIPLALFEGLFGRGALPRRGGLYRDDRSAQELCERRLRDSHRR